MFPTILPLVGIEPSAKHIVDGARLDTLLTGKRDLRRMMQGLIASMEKHNALYPVDKDGTTPLIPKLPRV